MVIYTCTNLGEAAVNELAPIISHKLADAKGSAAIMSSGWRTLAVGFENHIVTIDMISKTDRHVVVPAESFPAYTLRYFDKCRQSAQHSGNERR